MSRPPITRLEDVPNIGAAIAATLRRAGVRTPAALARRDPYALFETLCARAGRRLDPCLLAVCIAATRFMNGGPARPWWAFTKERKAREEKAGR